MLFFFVNFLAELPSEGKEIAHAVLNDLAAAGVPQEETLFGIFDMFTFPSGKFAFGSGGFWLSKVAFVSLMGLDTAARGTG